MAQHTPGPWTIVPYGDGDSLVIHADESEWRICFMATPGQSPGAMDRIEANARLVAAAPDMLEALKDALQMIAGLTPLPMEGLEDWVLQALEATRAKADATRERIREAIAKAEGR